MTLTLTGARVWWPLEPAPYDLVVDDGSGTLRRVQVKTTTQRRGDTWACHISRSRYDRSAGAHHRRIPYDPRDIDDVAVVDGDLNVYLIPYEVVSGFAVIHLRRYVRFAVRRFGCETAD